MLVYEFKLNALPKESGGMDLERFIELIEHDPENPSGSNMRFAYFPFEAPDFLENPEMKENYGHHGQILIDFFSPENKSQVTVPHPLIDRFNTKEAGIFRFNRGELQGITIIEELFAVQLFWGDVRIEVIDKSKKLGEWIAYAWNPNNNELYVYGRDFIPSNEFMDMSMTPENRGRPSDHLLTGANCGPSALAAYLNLSTAEVIEHLPIYIKKGWTNPPHVTNALKEMNLEHSHSEYQSSDGKNLSDVVSEFEHGLAFMQYFYRQIEKISHTHWVAFDNHEIGPVVYDVNVWENVAYGKGNWIPIEEWTNNVEPFVRENFRKQARYKRFDGYFVRDVISVNNFINS